MITTLNSLEAAALLNIGPRQFLKLAKSHPAALPYRVSNDHKWGGAHRAYRWNRADVEKFGKTWKRSNRGRKPKENKESLL